MIITLICILDLSETHGYKNVSVFAVKLLVSSLFWVCRQYTCRKNHFGIDLTFLISARYSRELLITGGTVPV